MSSDGRRLLSAIVFSQDLKAMGKLQLSADLFKSGESILYEFIASHIAKFGKIPSPETIEADQDLQGSLVETHEPPEFYMEAVEKRFLHSSLKEVVIQAQELLKEEESGKAFEALTDRIVSLMQKANRRHLFDFRDAYDLIIAEYKLKQKDNQEGGDYFVKYGWPTLDEMTGGIKPGDMVSFVGRPAAGKTFKLLYGAHFNWGKGHVPLFVSMEMTATIILQRLAMMDAHHSLTHLLKGCMSTPILNEMLKKLKANKDAKHPFWIVDGNMTTNVDDIIMSCRQLKPGAVFVDGAYLLRHPNPKIGKWDRMSENAESLKQKVATDLGIPVICSYQFSREAKKKKKDEKVTIDDIYGSDSIGQLSTVVLGLFEADNIETLARRKVEILKGRNGETGQFYINWEFKKMNFSEILKVDIEELKFIG